MENALGRGVAASNEERQRLRRELRTSHRVTVVVLALLELAILVIAGGSSGRGFGGCGVRVIIRNLDQPARAAQITVIPDLALIEEIGVGGIVTGQ